MMSIDEDETMAFAGEIEEDWLDEMNDLLRSDDIPTKVKAKAKEKEGACQTELLFPALVQPSLIGEAEMAKQFGGVAAASAIFTKLVEQQSVIAHLTEVNQHLQNSLFQIVRVQKDKDKEKEKETTLQKAQRLFKENKLESALETALTVLPTSSLLLGDIYAALNRYEEAYTHYIKCLDKPTVHWKIADMYKKSGRNDKEIEWHLRAFHNPNYSDQDKTIHVRRLAHCFFYGVGTAADKGKAFDFYERLAALDASN